MIIDPTIHIELKKEELRNILNCIRCSLTFMPLEPLWDDIAALENKLVSYSDTGSKLE